MMATPLSSMLLVIFASVLGSFGAVFLKLGALRITRFWHFANWRIVLGVGLYLGSSVFYGWGIKNGQISILFPMASLGYIWTMLWARLFFGEQITKQKFAALGMILLGVVFIGLAGS